MEQNGGGNADRGHQKGIVPITPRTILKHFVEELSNVTPRTQC